MELRAEKSDIRVDKYLALTADISRETINKMIAEDYILVNGKKTKPSYKIRINDLIEIKDGFFKEMKLEANYAPFDIVYEDDYLMVINKPSGLVVHPGNGNINNTLVNGLLYYQKQLSTSDDAFRPGIVHRLDKDTSGLMIVAKDDKCHELLAEGFKTKSIHREYIALVDGVFPHQKAIIDAPIGHSKTNYGKMAIDKDGKKAITHVEVKKRFKNYTLIKLVLETGRTHQIRVHMAYAGYPIHNDPLYSKKKSDEFGQFLHSEYLKFTHPITKKELEFHADVPKEFAEFLDQLD